MGKLKAYLLSNFSQIYFSIFLPLYVIASVIMLVKIAAFTSVIQLNLFEMVKLYLFMLPELLFYTLPVTFFISAVMTVSKLSFDYEMIVIFSLGVNPSTILRFFTKLALYQSALLILLFFVLAPHTKNLYKNFLKVKASEAKFNIQASEYGHKFGDWLIFVGQDHEEGHFSDVILFNQKDNEETLIVAKEANIVSEKGVLKLQLETGKGFTYSKDSLSQMSYRKLFINDTSIADTAQYKDTMQYWFNPDKREKMTKKFTINMLVALFPLLSVLLVPTIGIINARHQKGFTYAYIFLAVILYYGSTFAMAKSLGLYTIAIVSIVSLISVSYLYYQNVTKRY
ncbi:MAG: permease [Arcobacter sp.]|nr:MAG: permease [Arcobacter sp.]